MEVVRITPRGYCHGVVTAMRIAREVAAEAGGEPVHMLGQLIHNAHATSELEELGVTLVDPPTRLAGLDAIDRGTVVFTAHGVSPEVKRRAEARGLRTVDATCVDVARTHELVRELAGRGYEIVYLGRRGHPEPEGVIGEAPGRVHLVQELADVEVLEIRSERIAVTCQTTLSVWDTAELIEAVRRRYPGCEVHNEICRATQDRQEAAVRAAAEVDVVIVVGSPRSSNSRRLVEVVRTIAGKPAHLVDSAEELRPEWFQGVRRVGVTSGASTPTHLTRRVVEHLEQLEAGSGPV
jgi:4-hydroxy-3-methylbut-2-en-1-yl diphosphate reductase